MGNFCAKQHGSSVNTTAKAPKISPIELGTVIKNKWQLTRFIAGGGYGFVFEVMDVRASFPNKSTHKALSTPDAHVQQKINQPRALKLELLRSNKDVGHLPHEESVVLRIRSRGYARHFFEVFDHGPVRPGELKCSTKAGQYLVMSLLGPSLVDLADLCPKMAFSAATMLNISKQTLEAVESMHNTGYLHRDLKPSNFVSGTGAVAKHEIFLVDFGFARRFLDETGSRLPPRSKAPFRGTSPYASVTTFEGGEQSPADDLWSLFYTLIDLRTGRLPWGKASTSDRVNAIKKEIMPHEWLDDVEPEYLLMHDYLTSLHFDMLLDFGYLQGLFDQALARINKKMADPLDWEPGGPYFTQLDREKLSKMFAN